jgi:hypothetical protein
MDSLNSKAIQFGSNPNNPKKEYTVNQVINNKEYSVVLSSVLSLIIERSTKFIGIFNKMHTEFQKDSTDIRNRLRFDKNLSDIKGLADGYPERLHYNTIFLLELIEEVVDSWNMNIDLLSSFYYS